MATCLRYGYAGAWNYGAQSGTNYLLSSDGTANLAPLTLATFLLPDTVTTDISQCAAVGITGAEFVSLKTGNASASTGVATGYPAWNELGSLSLENAQAITPFIVTWWAVAWGYKQIVRAINPSEGNENE